MTDERGRGIEREKIQGKPVDPSGVDRESTGDDQKNPPGAEGREDGGAGKFTRGSSSEGIGPGESRSKG